MRPEKYLSAIILIAIGNFSISQVKTNFNSGAKLAERGRFDQPFQKAIDHVLPSKGINALLDKDVDEMKSTNEWKPLRIAEPTPVNIDIAGQMNWTSDELYAYGKYTIKASGALSVSINFDKFYLPKETEMYVYNENGEMITGPVTDAENTELMIWGSWVYKGEYLSIEVKTPLQSKDKLLLHSNNVAYGYKQIYKVGSFGQSGPCNINILCPLGNGWQGERNSVALILRSNGANLCSGSMVANNCNTNRPYFLTVNHCFVGDANVSGWRFTFQAWSPTCTPSQNSNGVTFNGSVLRANNAASDFCLVELSNTPSSNSNIHYAGWTRSATPATQATGIHHPRGDVMKISRANNAVVRASFGESTNQHWRADWSPQNNGAGQIVTAVTEPGSSGSPLFDQNHRIIGQLHGGPSVCNGTSLWDFYGSFDLSWTGGGANGSRLRNWLDPNNTGVITFNTTNILNLAPSPLQGSFQPITGSSVVCGTIASYSLSIPPTSTVIWQLTSPPAGSYNPPLQNVCTMSPSGSSVTLTKVKDGNVRLFATITHCGGIVTYAQKDITFGVPPIYYNGGYWTNGSYAPITGTTNLTSGSKEVWTLLVTANNNYSWQKTGGSSNVTWNYGSTSNNSAVRVYFNPPVTSGNYISFSIQTSNACGNRTDPYVIHYYGSPIYFSITPNPASDVLIIEEKDSTTNEATIRANIQVIEIVNKMGNVMYSQKYSNKIGGAITVTVRHLPNDIYTVRIYDGKEWHLRKVIIQH